MSRQKRGAAVELVVPDDPAPSRGPSVRTSKTRAVKEARADGTAEALVRSMFSDSLREVERKVKLTDSSSITADRVSTGSAALDLVLGGGLAPGFHQFSGQEASGKTTGGLLFLASVIRDPDINTAVFWDSENAGGCLVETATYSQNGVPKTVSEMFDLEAVDKSKGPHYTEQTAIVDTASNSEGGIESRTARLYYGGSKETTEVTLSDGTILRGAMHPVFVFRDGALVQILLEDLKEGDVLLRKKRSD